MMSVGTIAVCVGVRVDLIPHMLSVCGTAVHYAVS